MSIDLNAITSITVRSIDLAGEKYSLVWDGESLHIQGVHRWEQLAALLPALAAPAALLARDSKSPAAAVSQEAPPGRPPAAPPPAETPRQTAPADPGQRPAPPAAAPPAPRRPPLPVLAAPVSNAVSQEENSASRQDPTGGPAADPPDGADMSIFGRLTKFEDIFDELVRRNEGANYVTIRNKVQLLMDTEMCPALDRLNKDGKLEERIKRRCAAKGVAGALDA